MTIKLETLAKYITPGCVFVESGTRWADTSINAIRLGASKAITVEHDSLMATMARLHANDAIPRIEPATHPVDIFCMDSVEMLSANWLWHFLKHSDVVVFLDAHTDRRSPLLEELDAMASWPVKPLYILADDRRCWKGWGVDEAKVMRAIQRIGNYMTSYDDGVVKDDILVALKEK